jgi:hypothetical protein
VLKISDAIVSAAKAQESRVTIPGSNPSRKRQSLADDQKAALGRSLAVIETFRNIRPDMPIGHAFAFFLVALDEGLGVQEYARQCNVAQSVMTRWLFDIGMQTRERKPGLGLVRQCQDPTDMRRHQTFLTDAGRALAFQLIRATGK